MLQYRYSVLTKQLKPRFWAVFKKFLLQSYRICANL